METRRGGKGKGGAGFSCLFIQFPVAELGFLGVKPLEARKLLLFFSTILLLYSGKKSSSFFPDYFIERLFMHAIASVEEMVFSIQKANLN